MFSSITPEAFPELPTVCVLRAKLLTWSEGTADTAGGLGDLAKRARNPKIIA